MKKTKLLFIIFTMLMISTIANALGKKPVGGLKLGLNVANMDASGSDSILGLNVGGFVTYQQENNIAFQPEIYFSMKGAETSGTLGSLDIKLNYIQVPLLMKYGFPTGSNAQFAFLIGPSVNINISSEADINYNNNEFAIIGTYDITNENKLGLSLIFGGQIDFGKAIIEARYDLGMTNVFDVDERAEANEISITDNLKNRTLSVSLGIKM